MSVEPRAGCHVAPQTPLSVVGVEGIEGGTQSMPLLVCHGAM